MTAIRTAFPQPGIGTTVAPQWQPSTITPTGRTFQQLTSGPGHHYPLYYFVPSITADNRKLIYHSTRTGWVQLYSMDLQTGLSTQLSDGRTLDSGWAIWCEPRFNGIYNHLSALNLKKNEVYYFQDAQPVSDPSRGATMELRCTHLETLANDVVLSLPGRMSIGQSSFSPDGRRFAFIHADYAAYRHAVTQRLALTAMGLFDPERGHEAWRDTVPCVLGMVDTATGKYHEVKAFDYHVHHVIFADDQRLLINHPRGEMGMFLLNLDGTGYRHLRPRDERGVVCHQIVNADGIHYEVYGQRDGENVCWLGRYDLATERYTEVFLPGVRYAHTGHDPAGRFLFVDHRGATEDLFTIHFPSDPARFELRHLHQLADRNQGLGQRGHGHPFLDPSRRRMFFTQVIAGRSHICMLDVSDLTAVTDDGWGQCMDRKIG